MVSDVEVATLMSGEFDSTTTAPLVKPSTSQDQNITLSFDEEVSTENELENAKLVAEKWKMNHHIKSYLVKKWL